VRSFQHLAFRIDVDALIRGEVVPEQLADFILAHTGNEPMVLSSGSLDEVANLHRRYNATLLSERLDRLFGETAR
jgi:uncharacterized protein YgbK (DUF1537 family)